MKKSDQAASWLSSSRGTQLLSDERERLGRALRRLFGRTLLQIGHWAPGLLSGASHWRTGVLGVAGDAQVICDFSALPLAPGSVDAVLLAHSLESAPSAHRLLREVDRVLTDRGQLLILGFNPNSLWGWRQRLMPWYPALPVKTQLLSIGRLQDWLRLLDYDVVECERFGPGSNIGLSWLQPLLSFFAPAYLIQARKRRVPVNPIPSSVWRRRATADLDGAHFPTTGGGTCASVRRDDASANVAPFSSKADL
jgi:SAM-dependent methyltransferase